MVNGDPPKPRLKWTALGGGVHTALAGDASLRVWRGRFGASEWCWRASVARLGIELGIGSGMAQSDEEAKLAAEHGVRMWLTALLVDLGAVP